MTEDDKAFREALAKAKTLTKINAAVMLIPENESIDSYNFPSPEDVDKWLDKNVMVFSEPKIITLSRFKFNDIDAEFTLTLDSVTILTRIDFDIWPKNSTLIEIYLPKFHSPLGVPCSYPAIEITENTKKLIKATIREDLFAGKITKTYSVTIEPESTSLT